MCGSAPLGKKILNSTAPMLGSSPTCHAPMRDSMYFMASGRRPRSPGGGDADSGFELGGFVGSLPRHVEIGAPEVAVRRGLFEDRPPQVERFDNASGPQVERLRDRALDPFCRHL